MAADKIIGKFGRICHICQKDKICATFTRHKFFAVIILYPTDIFFASTKMAVFYGPSVSDNIRNEAHFAICHFVYAKMEEQPDIFDNLDELNLSLPFFSNTFPRILEDCRIFRPDNYGSGQNYRKIW